MGRYKKSRIWFVLYLCFSFSIVFGMEKNQNRLWFTIRSRFARPLEMQPKTSPINQTAEQVKTKELVIKTEEEQRTQSFITPVENNLEMEKQKEKLNSLEESFAYILTEAENREARNKKLNEELSDTLTKIVHTMSRIYKNIEEDLTNDTRNSSKKWKNFLSVQRSIISQDITIDDIESLDARKAVFRIRTNMQEKFKEFYFICNEFVTLEKKIDREVLKEKYEAFLKAIKLFKGTHCYYLGQQAFPHAYEAQKQQGHLSCRKQMVELSRTIKKLEKTIKEFKEEMRAKQLKWGQEHENYVHNQERLEKTLEQVKKEYKELLKEKSAQEIEAKIAIQGRDSTIEKLREKLKLVDEKLKTEQAKRVSTAYSLYYWGRKLFQRNNRKFKKEIERLHSARKYEHSITLEWVEKYENIKRKIEKNGIENIEREQCKKKIKQLQRKYATEYADLIEKIRNLGEDNQFWKNAHSFENKIWKKYKEKYKNLKENSSEFVQNKYREAFVEECGQRIEKLREEKDCMIKNLSNEITALKELLVTKERRQMTPWQYLDGVNERLLQWIRSKFHKKVENSYDWIMDEDGHIKLPLLKDIKRVENDIIRRIKIDAFCASMRYYCPTLENSSQKAFSAWDPIINRRQISPMEKLEIIDPFVSRQFPSLPPRKTVQPFLLGSRIHAFERRQCNKTGPLMLSVI